MLTLDIGPSHSAIILPFTFFPTLVVIGVVFEHPAYPCTTEDTEGVLGGHCGTVGSKQETPGCFCGVKGMNTSRRQNAEQSSRSCSRAAFSRRELLGALSPQGSNRTGLSVLNSPKNIIPLLIPFSFMCVLFLDFTKCFLIVYFLRILPLFLYYEVIIHSTVPSSELACGRCLGFYFFFPVISFDLRRKSTGGNCHFNESLNIL